MVMCEIYGNEIMVDPTKNRMEGETMRTYQMIIDRLHSKGILPKKDVLYSKASEKYKETTK